MDSPQTYKHNGKVVQQIPCEFQEEDAFEVKVNYEPLAKALLEVAGWIWQNGAESEDAVRVRATIFSWVFLPKLRPLSLRQLASVSGIKRPTLGKYFIEFQEKFPFVRTEHCRK